MESLHNFTQEELLEMLLTATKQYTQMISAMQMHTEEFTECKALIIQIQHEIESRSKENARV